MAAIQEVHSFVRKFLNLYSIGENADLSLKCKDGRITIGLQLDLHPDQPPSYHPTPPPRPHPQDYQQRLSPSRIRRSKRRAQARTYKYEAEVLNPVNIKAKASEKVAVSSTHNSCEKTPDTAEQAGIVDTKNQNNEVDHDQGGSSYPQLQRECGDSVATSISTVEEAIIENGDVENKTKEETTDTVNTFSQDDFDKIVDIMEDFKKNFAADFKSSLKVAFKPP